MMNAVTATALETAVIADVCTAVGLSSESFPRHHVAVSRPLAPSPPRLKTARASATEERKRVCDLQRLAAQVTLKRRQLPLRRKPPNWTDPDGATASVVGASWRRRGLHRA